LAGPYLLRLVFHTFVVVVGALILAGAVNTAIIGANSVLNRVAEDGILFPWFRKPHRKYGTTYRLINLIVGLQLFTILISRGDVYLLGEAYAFGVVWSFFLKSCGVMVLRYQRSDQEYKVPLNIRIRGIELPIGLGLITLTLLTVALVNLFSKRIATIYGIIFTLVLFIVFTISERINARKHQKRKGGALEEFNLDHQQEITTDIVNVQPGGMLVAVRDYNTLSHLKWALDRTQAGRRNVIVATVRLTAAGDGEHGLTTEQVFADYEKELFSRVVQLAEKEGKKVSLLVVPAANPFEAMVQAAANLRSAYLVTGVSAHMSAEELARRIGQAWEELPEPRHSFSLAVMRRDGTVHQVILGPHTPRLRPQDVNRVHQLWLDLAENEEFGAKLHHRDVISLALDRLEQELKGHQRFEIVRDLRRSLEKPEA
ncbi:MAG TPA: APC family permease, partial [Oligoflexia bacterium]|nr:APC family permease [Oligoflexia bacterium]